MRVLLANKIGLALFVKGHELFAEYAQLCVHEDFSANEVCFYVNTFTPSI